MLLFRAFFLPSVMFHRFMARRPPSEPFPCTSRRVRAGYTTPTILFQRWVDFTLHPMNLHCIQMELLDAKWDLDHFNLIEATALGELVSNLTHLNECSK